MGDSELLEAINRFPRWDYQFRLGDHLTPVLDDRNINRHRQQREYFFRPLLNLCGGSLAGKRVLDLGCNAGFWSLAAVENGCDFVLGIDHSQMHIEQAHLVFEVSRIPRCRYEFRLADVFEVMSGNLGFFEVTLCRELLARTDDPITLLERISRVNTDFLLIDTSLTEHAGSVLELKKELSTNDGSDSDKESLVMCPSRGAVIEMARKVGYEARALRPRFSDYTGAEDYLMNRRRAFLCSKRTPLVRLNGDAEVD